MPSPATTATTSVALGSVATTSQQPLLALHRLLVHVRDLDALDHADARADGERGAGLVRMDVHLERLRVADDEQGVAEPRELRFDLVRVELVALDHERRAVAVARQLLVDRVRAELLALDRRRGQLLAGDGRGEPAHDLQESRAAGVDDARLAEDVELLRRARERLLATPHDRRQQRRGVAGGAPSLSSAISRMTDSIVPSTGSRTARYAASRAPWNARATTAASIFSASPSTSAAPRRICDRITPELPRAPISAARVTSFTSAGRSVALERSRPSTTARAVDVMFVPVSPSGTG